MGVFFLRLTAGGGPIQFDARRAARSVTQTCATGNQRLHRGVRFRCCRNAHRQPPSARQRLWACANPRQHSGWPRPPLRNADTFRDCPSQAYRMGFAFFNRFQLEINSFSCGFRSRGRNRDERAAMTAHAIPTTTRMKRAHSNCMKPPENLSVT